MLTPELMEVPSRDEVEGIVKKLKADKAPGSDGVTAEVLADLLGVHLVKITRNRRGSFRYDKSLITFSTSASGSELGQTNCTQQVVFIKLDFIKAYDRVSHPFLWETLRAMGFADAFINLIQGFTCDGSAKMILAFFSKPKLNTSRNYAESLLTLQKLEEDKWTSVKWGAADILLTGKSVLVPRISQPLQHLLQTWKFMRKRLGLMSGIVEIPGWMPIMQLQTFHELQPASKVQRIMEDTLEATFGDGRSPMKYKIWACRVLARGLMTMEKARQWGVADNLCPWGCGSTGNYKSSTEELQVPGCHAELGWQTHLGCHNASFFQVINLVLETHKTVPGQFILFATHSEIGWKERNKKVFEDRSSRLPNPVLA
ncbi:hypothetical protein R1sor_001027 [Riccia sorocarpa]|uniref:Reverse transcriptase domain-containing protein n=1 Tax=Riccia sorocarpa TaxID=122646 RepID=A0ABD3GY17_9MARC